jgi:NifU-like protein
MWEYTDKVTDLYKNPKNAGMIEDADAVGEAGSLTCGDMLKLYLKVDENGIITDAKFQTFGCGSAVASSSILTEMIIGMPIDEARKITNKDIVDELGGLPPAKMHCSVMGHEALESAIANFYGETCVAEKKEKIICQCFNVSEETIKEQIKTNNLKTVEEVTEYTKAGGGCGHCKSAIEAILKDVNKSKKTLTKTQEILKVSKVIEKYISPELRKDSGDIELVDVDGNKIYIKFEGKCSACQKSQLTKNYVEKILRNHISEDIEVILV